MDLKTKICYSSKGCHYKLKMSWFEYVLPSRGALNTRSKQISESSSAKGSLELNIWPHIPTPEELEILPLATHSFDWKHYLS